MLNKCQNNVFYKLLSILLFIIASLGSIGLLMGLRVGFLGASLFDIAIISLVLITLNYFAYLDFMKSESIFNIFFWVWIVPQILVVLLLFWVWIGPAKLTFFILIILFILVFYEIKTYF